MNDTKKTQILYTLNTKALHKLGANWLNITFDIHDYLTSIGFEYDRCLGYIRDGDTPEEELKIIGAEILQIGLGKAYFLALDITILENVTSLMHIFREKE